jgi:hypothetical protein
MAASRGPATPPTSTGFRSTAVARALAGSQTDEYRLVQVGAVAFDVDFFRDRCDDGGQGTKDPDRLLLQDRAVGQEVRLGPDKLRGQAALVDDERDSPVSRPRSGWRSSGPEGR